MLDSADRTIAQEIETWLRVLPLISRPRSLAVSTTNLGVGWYNDMEVGAPLWPNGASIDDRVDIFLDGLLGIAYETTMPEAASFADHYLAIVRDAAYAAASP